SLLKRYIIPIAITLFMQFLWLWRLLHLSHFGRRRRLIMVFFQRKLIYFNQIHPGIFGFTNQDRFFFRNNAFLFRLVYDKARLYLRQLFFLRGFMNLLINRPGFFHRMKGVFISSHSLIFIIGDIDTIGHTITLCSGLLHGL